MDGPRLYSSGMLTLILAAALASASPKPSTCPPELFTQAKLLVSVSACRRLLRSDCSAPSSELKPSGEILPSYKVLATNLTIHGIDNFQKFGARQTAKQAVFSEALENGAYLKSRVYGDSVYKGLPEVSSSRFISVVKEAAIWSLVFEAYFAQSKNPRQCSQRDESITTQKIESHSCAPDYRVSENVLKFLNRSPDEQQKLSQELPKVCDFYEKLNAKLKQDLSEEQTLDSYTCDGNQVKTLKVINGGITYLIQPHHLNDGRMDSLALAQEGTAEPAARLAFDEKQAAIGVQLRRKTGTQAKWSLHDFLNLENKMPEDQTFVRSAMSAWWSALPITQACCQDPNHAGCSGKTPTKSAKDHSGAPAQTSH